MFLRFAVAALDRDSERGTGIFQVVGALIASDDLPTPDRPELERIRTWFDERLDKPVRFTSAKPPYYRKQQRAISWFRDSATETYFEDVRDEGIA